MITINEIDAWRAAHGLTKKELASLLGISYTFLVNILNGRRDLSAATAAKFELLRKGDSRPRSIDDVMAFAVRLTPEEYQQMCEVAGARDLSPAEMEAAVRELLQRTWDALAARARDIVGESLESAASDDVLN